MLQLCLAGMLQVPNRDTNQSFRLSAAFREASRIKCMWSLLIALFTNDRCVMKKYLFFELNLKWIFQIIFFAATRRLMLFIFSSFSVLIAQCVMPRERKLKFQIVYNYFSINCHTLNNFTSRFFLFSFWIMEDFLARYLFLVFCCAFRSEKINYL